VRPDLVAVDNERSPRDYLGRFWVDSALHDVAALEQVVRLFGSNRVCLGTDYPFPLGESEPGRLISDAGLDAASTEAMLGSNALEWLGRA
jgi:aminocarboxymuconate-semialdehyde decarboxylase